MGVAFLVFRLAEAIMADPRGHTPYMIPFIQNIQNRQVRRGRCRSGWFPEAVGKGSLKARLLMGLRSSHRATGTFRIRYKWWLYTSMNVLNATKSHVDWLFLSLWIALGSPWKSNVLPQRARKTAHFPLSIRDKQSNCYSMARKWLDRGRCQTSREMEPGAHPTWCCAQTQPHACLIISWPLYWLVMCLPVVLIMYTLKKSMCIIVFDLTVNFKAKDSIFFFFLFFF